jgi:myosin heavy subunit
LALTRAKLKAMGLEDEKIEAIIDEHSESVTALKQQRDEYRAKAEQADELSKQVEALKASGAGNDENAEKLAALTAEFDAYKQQVANEKGEAEKRGLYRELLAKAGVDAKRIDSVLKVSDLSNVTVKDGALENAAELTEGIKTDWADFIATTTTEGASVAHPVTGGTKTGATAQDFKHMSIRDRQNLFESDPDTYRALANAKE